MRTQHPLSCSNRLPLFMFKFACDKDRIYWNWCHSIGILTYYRYIILDTRANIIMNMKYDGAWNAKIITMEIIQFEIKSSSFDFRIDTTHVPDAFIWCQFKYITNVRDNRAKHCLVSNYSTGVQIASCTLSGDSVLSEWYSVSAH